MKRQRIFIGCSSESHNIAEHLQVLLDRELEVTIFSQNFFPPSSITLTSIEEQAKTFDYGCFLFTPDDLTESRNTQTSSPRDNVVFELGFFMGALGISNVFLIKPRGVSVKIPSDLQGFTFLDYEPNRSDNNWQAALGPASTQIKNRTKELGPQKTKVLITNFLDKLSSQIFQRLRNQNEQELEIQLQLTSNQIMEIESISKLPFADSFISLIGSHGNSLSSSKGSFIGGQSVIYANNPFGQPTQDLTISLKRDLI